MNATEWYRLSKVLSRSCDVRAVAVDAHDIDNAILRVEWYDGSTTEVESATDAYELGAFVASLAAERDAMVMTDASSVEMIDTFNESGSDAARALFIGCRTTVRDVRDAAAGLDPVDTDVDSVFRAYRSGWTVDDAEAFILANGGE